MKAEHKSPEQIAQEKRRIAELKERVLRATDGIPRHVLGGSHQTAVAFKQAASAARAMVLKGTNQSKLHKMEEAWNLIQSYYRETV